MAMSRRLLSFSKPWHLVTHRGQFHPSGWEAFGVGYMWRRLQCAIMLLAAIRFRSVVVIAVGRFFYMWLVLKGIASPRPLQAVDPDRGPVGPGLKPLHHWAPLLPLFRRLLPFCGGRQYYQWNRLAKPVLITYSAVLITCSARRMAYPAEPPWAAQWISGAWSSRLEARWARG